MKSNSDIYLSICIPCYERLEYVRRTIKSIYEEVQLFNLLLSDFEVVISDNNTKNSSLRVLESEFKYENFHYYNTSCDGFMNSYYSLSYGKGQLLKLHNSQEIWNSGSLSRILNVIKSNITDKPLLFFSSGLLYKGKSFEVDSFDLFMNKTCYLSSWSNAFCIWKEDFDRLPTNLPLDSLFPHTTLLLTQNRKRRYLVLDEHFFTTQFVSKRGGHNKFHAFSAAYPALIVEAFEQGIISEVTKKKILDSVLYEYLPLLFFNVKIARRETFSSFGFKEDLKAFFPKGSYYVVALLSFLIPFKILWRKVMVKYVLQSKF